LTVTYASSNGLAPRALAPPPLRLRACRPPGGPAVAPGPECYFFQVPRTQGQDAKLPEPTCRDATGGVRGSAAEGLNVQTPPVAREVQLPRAHQSIRLQVARFFLLTQLLARVLGDGVERRQLQCECRDEMILHTRKRALVRFLSLSITPASSYERSLSLFTRPSL